MGITQAPQLLAQASTLGELRGVRLYLETLGLHGQVVHEPSRGQYYLVNDALYQIWLKRDVDPERLR